MHCPVLHLGADSFSDLQEAALAFKVASCQLSESFHGPGPQ